MIEKAGRTVGAAALPEFLNLGVMLWGRQSPGGAVCAQLDAVVRMVAAAVAEAPSVARSNGAGVEAEAAGVRMRVIGLLPDGAEGKVVSEGLGEAYGAVAKVADEAQWITPGSLERLSPSLNATTRASFLAEWEQATARVALEGIAGSSRARDLAVQILLDNVQVLLMGALDEDVVEREWLEAVAHRAVDAGIVVFQVNASGGVRVLGDEGRDEQFFQIASREEISGIVAATLSTHLKQLFAEGSRPQLKAPSSAPKRLIEQTRKEWGEEWRTAGALGEAFGAATDAPLLEPYVWSDHEACRADLRYHRLGIFRYSFLFLAAACVALGFYVKDFDRVAFFGQFVFVFLAFGVLFLDRYTQAHAALIDYRVLAELLRIARLLRFTGRRLHLDRLDESLFEEYPQWLIRRFDAVQRAAGLSTMTATPETCAQYAAFVAKILDGQIAYQRKCARKNYRKYRYLTCAAWLAFACSVMAIFLRFSGAWWLSGGINNAAWHYIVVKFLAIVLPGVTALLYGVASFGAYKSLAQRATLMAVSLEEKRGRILNCAEDHILLFEHVYETARMMLSEVLDWRGLIKEKKIGFPM